MKEVILDKRLTEKIRTLIMRLYSAQEHGVWAGKWTAPQMDANLETRRVTQALMEDEELESIFKFSSDVEEDEDKNDKPEYGPGLMGKLHKLLWIYSKSMKESQDTLDYEISRLKRKEKRDDK